jgi:hypothetical protein
MLSGIGPPDVLERHKIKVEVPLRGVGENLQDRYEVGIVHKMKRDFAILKDVALTTNDPEFTNWLNGQASMRRTVSWPRLSSGRAMINPSRIALVCTPVIRRLSARLFEA